MPEAQSVAAKAAGDFCRNLERACRESRMYPAGHRTLITGFDQLQAATERALQAAAPVRLTISDTTISLLDEVVYTGIPDAENLAFVLFRDGIRELILYWGVQREELALLVDIIANVDAIDRWEHDLATTLWEADFLNIDYMVADPTAGGAEIDSEILDQLREVVLRRMAQAEQAVTEMGDAERDTPPPSSGGPSGSATAWATASAAAQVQEFLDEPHVEADVIRGGDEDPCPLEDLHLFLAELLRIADSPETAEPLVRAVTAETGSRLLNGDRDTAWRMIDRLHVAAEESTSVARALSRGDLCASELKEAAHMLLLERSAGGGDHDELLLDDFTLRPLLVPALLELLLEEDDRAVRRSLLGVLTAHRDLPAHLILPHLNDPRWYVVRNMLQLLAASVETPSPAELEPAIRYPDVRVRKEVVRTVERMTAAGRETSNILRLLLRDADSGVRALAARVVGPQIREAGMAELLAQVVQPDFVTRPVSEIEAMLEAVARLARAGLAAPQALDTLDSLWRARFWRKKPEVVRVAAVKALAVIPGPEAEQRLRKAAASREAAIRLPAGELLARRAQDGAGT